MGVQSLSAPFSQPRFRATGGDVPPRCLAGLPAPKHHLSSFCLSHSCWDMNDNTALWWVIKGPVVGSIMVSMLGTRSRRETEVWAERSGGGEIKWSPRKPTFFITAALYSAIWMYKFFSYSTSVGHLSLFHFTSL